ncbi:retrovirus-related pol polyprotein from transposon TNT 1-94 [Tanacetum coccineum]
MAKTIKTMTKAQSQDRKEQEKDQRPHELNAKSNLTDLMKECQAKDYELACAMQCNTTCDAYQFSDELEMSLVEHLELFTPPPDEVGTNVTLVSNAQPNSRPDPERHAQEISQSNQVHTLCLSVYDTPIYVRNSQVKNCKIDILTQEYEKFSISNAENIDSGFKQFNAIVTSLKYLDPDNSSKNHVRKFLRALPLKWKAKVYEMVVDNNGVEAKTTKEKVKSLALKAKFTREKTSDDSDMVIDSIKAIVIALETKAVESKDKREFATIAGDSEDGDEHQKDATCLMAIDSQEVQAKLSIFNNDTNIVDLQKENEELLKFSKDFSKAYEKLLQEKRALEKEHSKHFIKVIELELEVKKLARSKEVCLKCNLLLDDWIVDSGCTKHMTRNRIFFTSYKAYDGGHVVFWRNLKGKVIGGGNITHDSITVTNVEYVSGLAFNLISVVHLTKFDPKSYEGVFLGYSQTSKAYIVLNKEIMRIEESLNVTFDEGLPEPKSSPSVKDDRINEPVVQDLNGSPSLQVNVSDEGYPKSVKEARSHPIEQVISEMNERTLSYHTVTDISKMDKNDAKKDKTRAQDWKNGKTKMRAYFILNGPKPRQPDATTGTLKAAKDAHIDDEGGQAILALV